MNSSVIRYILGWVLKIEAVLLLPPIFVAMIYQEAAGYRYVVVMLLCLISGMLISYKKPENPVFYLKDGCVATALSWIVLSIFGALPFYLTGEIPSYLDALFETISGFTTTGASILSDVESLNRCSLFWRSFTHWIGGMGVLVFLLAIIPMTGGSHMNLMRAESPGPTVGKLVPKVKSTARILYLIYFGMTVVEIILLLIGKMPLFDAITLSFGTAGTGGFGVLNDSLASYTMYQQWIVTIFMILFGINFNLYYLLLFGQVKNALKMEEVRYYLIIILSAITFVTVNIMETSTNIFRALLDASFQVSSIITTTGFSTVDFNTWNQSCKTVLILLMFIGACAGSTGGGIKVSRFVILFKTVLKELHSYIHPKSIKKISYEGKALEHEVLRATNVYMITFITVFFTSVLLISMEGNDFTTNFTAVAATINNIGPGLELVGPTENFGHFGPFSKLILMFDMLAGRLELFPLLILFHPAVWLNLFKQKQEYKNKKKKV